MTHRRSSAVPVVAALVVILAMAGCRDVPSSGATQSGPTPPSSSTQPLTAQTPPTDKPNIVHVLTDDLSSDLIRYMPQVRQMQREGVRFTNYSVSDTLCCPSRVSMLTGQFPHNTGIFTNSGDDGGFKQFHEQGGERSTIGTHLQQAGYRTGFMGKYLNGYRPERAVDAKQGYVPPGWNSWAVAGNGYKQYNYTLNENGRLVDYGHAPQDYLTDVLSRKGAGFIRSNTEAGNPFYLQLNTFSPHTPATPAPRDKQTFRDVRAPRQPAFNEGDLSDKPGWLRDRPELTAKQQKRIDKLYRKRVRSVQAIDDMLGTLRDTLRQTGQADNTYVVFNSDNGYHMGEHRLMPGKQTAFESDVTVPLTVAGPGIEAGRQVEQPAQNIDLRPTFGDIAGTDTPPDVDGSSLLPLLRGENPRWRTTSLIEHHGPNNAKADPDRQGNKRGNPPTYTAIRTPEETYVEYHNGEREYYDRRDDPHQLTNSYPNLPAHRQESLHHTLTALRDCRGNQACTEAGQPH